MRIFVAVKQVPRLDQIRFTRANRVDREVESILNPVDLYAFGHALALRREEDEVVVVTMGPPAAREVLDELVRRGADRALHLTDRRFAGADTLITARTLLRALEREGFDLLLVGRSTLDGATAQVGPQLAELGGLPQVTQATAIERADGGLRVVRETERGTEVWHTALPAVVTVERGPACPPADPGREPTVAEVTMDDLGGVPLDYGTRASPTFVKAIRPVEEPRARVSVNDAVDGATRIGALIDGVAHAERDAAPAGPGRIATATDRELWVLAERDGERLHPVSLEGLVAARTVAHALDAVVVAVILGTAPDELADELAGAGSDRVLVGRHPSFASYTTAGFTEAVSWLIADRSPHAVIAPWTSQGRDFFPRVAARLGLGLTGDFVGLELEDRDAGRLGLMWLKPAWAGTVVAPIMCHTTPSLGTLRPGCFAAPASGSGALAPVEVVDVPVSGPALASCEERHLELPDEPLVEGAAIVLCVGGGLDRDLVARVHRVAAGCGAAVGAGPAAVASGLVAPQAEVGILKRSIEPRLFIAFGRHGAETMDAARRSGRIVTVGTDADVSVDADLSVVAEPADVLAALERAAVRGR